MCIVLVVELWVGLQVEPRVELVVVMGPAFLLPFLLFGCRIGNVALTHSVGPPATSTLKLQQRRSCICEGSCTGASETMARVARGVGKFQRTSDPFWGGGKDIMTNRERCPVTTADMAPKAPGLVALCADVRIEQGYGIDAVRGRNDELRVCASEAADLERVISMTTSFSRT